MEAKVITITVVLNETGSDAEQVAESIVHNMKYCDEYDSDGIKHDECNIKEITWKLK